MRRAAEALFEELDVQIRRRRAGPRPVDGRPAAHRDRQGAVGRGARPDPRRADGLAVRARGGAAVHDRPPPARPRRRRPVRQPPARRGLRAVRPRDRLPRRPPRRHDADERADDRRPRPAHGRPGRVAVPEGRDAGRRRPARGRRPDPRPACSTTSASRVRAGEIVGFAGPGRGRPDGGRARPVRDRPARRRRDPPRRQARRLRQPVRGDARRDRLPARGPPPGGARPRLLDRPERDPADPAAAVPAAASSGRRPSAASPTSTPSSSTSG